MSDDRPQMNGEAPAADSHRPPTMDKNARSGNQDDGVRINPAVNQFVQDDPSDRRLRWVGSMK
jgi:hypothetical protein